MKENVVGRKFNMLTVLSQAQSRSKWKTYWNCKCDCGNFTVVSLSNLKSGAVKSCGCLLKPKSEFPEVEQLTKEERKILRSRWSGMIKRCYIEDNSGYKYYGAKGVKVCDEWKNSFDKFALWSIKNGFNKTLTLDRIDFNGDYCPENCRWATWKQQENNKSSNISIEYNGETLTIAQISEKYGINMHTLFDRIKYQGMDIKSAIETPVKSHKSHVKENKTFNLSEMSKKAGINRNTVWRRIYELGWSLEDALSVPARKKNKR